MFIIIVKSVKIVRGQCNNQNNEIRCILKK